MTCADIRVIEDAFAVDTRGGTVGTHLLQTKQRAIELVQFLEDQFDVPDNVIFRRGGVCIIQWVCSVVYITVSVTPMGYYVGGRPASMDAVKDWLARHHTYLYL